MVVAAWMVARRLLNFAVTKPGRPLPGPAPRPLGAALRPRPKANIDAPFRLLPPLSHKPVVSMKNGVVRSSTIVPSTFGRSDRGAQAIIGTRGYIIPAFGQPKSKEPGSGTVGSSRVVKNTLL